MDALAKQLWDDVKCALRALLCTDVAHGGAACSPRGLRSAPERGGRGGARAVLLTKPGFCGGQQGELVGVFGSPLVHLLASSLACMPSTPCARALLCAVCPRCTYMRTCLHVCRKRPVMVDGCVPGAADGGAALSPSSHGCPSRSRDRGGERAVLLEKPGCYRGQQGELVCAFGAPLVHHLA